MQFTIQEKKHELTEGYFMLIMKFGVLFLIAWMFGLLIIYTYPCLAWDSNKYPPFLRFLNDYHILSWFFVIILFYWYSIKKHNSYQFGFLTKIEFNKLTKEFKLDLIHPLHGKEYQINIPESKFRIFKKRIHSQWTGNKTAYEFYENEKLITTLIPSRSAWKLNTNYQNFKSFLNTLCEEN